MRFDGFFVVISKRDYRFKAVFSISFHYHNNYEHITALGVIFRFQ